MTPHVLVVDDDAFFAEAATAMLEQDERLQVVGRAANGRDAVRLALALRPDVVLMDIHMPVLDGLEATRRLRRLLPSARIVLVTSSTSPEDRREATQVGAFAFMTKDLGPEALVEAALAAAVEGAAR